MIAWNIGVMAAVFSPSDLTFWVTKGLAPAVYSEFVGFNLKDELAGAQAGTRLPMIPEDPVVRSQEYQGFMAYQAGYIYLGRMYEEMGNAEKMRAFFAKALKGQK